jgi:hypothetical protein
MSLKMIVKRGGGERCGRVVERVRGGHTAKKFMDGW